LTGGVHAREWGGCEILVNLPTDLCDAYAGGTGVQYGGKYYSATEVKALIEQINIIIFPCVNPDGRNFSQTSDIADNVAGALDPVVPASDGSTRQTG
jgi:murein tripeptide amidase MpaA